MSSPAEAGWRGGDCPANGEVALRKGAVVNQGLILKASLGRCAMVCKKHGLSLGEDMLCLLP